MTKIIAQDTFMRHIDANFTVYEDEIILNQFGADQIHKILADTTIFIETQEMRVFSTISVSGLSTFYFAVDVYTLVVVQYKICSACGMLTEIAYKICNQ